MISLKPNLKRHIRIHTKKKTFEFSYCFNTFSRKQRLNTHICIQSQERLVFFPQLSIGISVFFKKLIFVDFF